MLCTFHIPRWQLDVDHLAEQLQEHALAFVAGHALVERHSTLEGAAEDADFLATLWSLARELDEAVDLPSPDADHLGVGQLRRQLAGHQQPHDARGPQDRIPAIDHADEDVGRKQPHDATMPEADAWRVGLEAGAHQQQPRGVFALRFGLSDGPEIHAVRSFASLSSTQPMIVEGLPSPS